MVSLPHNTELESKVLNQMESEMLVHIRKMIEQADELIISLEKLNQYFS